MQKVCRTCKVPKDKESEFYPRNPDCKSCYSKKKKKYRGDNPVVTKLVTPLEGEYWVEINGWEGLHRISSFGRISSLCNSVRKIARPMKVEKILKPHLNSYTGYYAYVFSDWGRGGKDKRMNIHRVVALHFIPNPNNFPEVNHKDGNKINNKVDNLEWVTREQNIQHGFKNNLIKTLSGEKAHNNVLSNEQVLFIYNYKGNLRQMGRDLKIPYSSIAGIRNGTSWNSVTGAPKKYYGKEKDKPRYT